jgi:hypothetical protein
MLAALSWRPLWIVGPQGLPHDRGGAGGGRRSVRRAEASLSGSVPHEQSPSFTRNSVAASVSRNMHLFDVHAFIAVIQTVHFGPVKESRKSPKPGDRSATRRTQTTWWRCQPRVEQRRLGGAACDAVGYRHGTNWVQVAWLRRSEPMRTAGHDRIGAITYSVPQAALHSEP